MNCITVSSNFDWNQIFAWWPTAGYGYHARLGSNDLNREHLVNVKFRLHRLGRRHPAKSVWQLSLWCLLYFLYQNIGNLGFLERWTANITASSRTFSTWTRVRNLNGVACRCEIYFIIEFWLWPSRDLGGSPPRGVNLGWIRISTVITAVYLMSHTITISSMTVIDISHLPPSGFSGDIWHALSRSLSNS